MKSLLKPGQCQEEETPKENQENVLIAECPSAVGLFLIQYKGISITARLSARAKIHRASDTSDSHIKAFKGMRRRVHNK